MTVPVYLEIGARRSFAGAIDWPGWCRSGRTQEEALRNLLAYGARYRRAVGDLEASFATPSDLSELEVVEVLAGDATTDFGAPGRPPVADDRPLDEAELERQSAILRASWVAFDAAVRAAAGIVLLTGPRGGGRDLARIVAHVKDAEQAYLARLGSRPEPSAGGEADEELARHRRAILDALAARARGLPLARPNRARTLWSPRYFTRRAAWHVLDHAWEVEDRAG